MRKVILAMALCLILCLTSCAQASRVILFSAYEQQGWGDKVQALFVDEDGRVGRLSGYASSMGWPRSPEEQAAYLASAESAEDVGAFSFDTLFDIKSLIESAADQGRELHAGDYCDYGVTYSYAVRYDREGAASCVLLGAYGDSSFLNTDPNAQGLYARLVSMSDENARLEDVMSFVGCKSVPLADFLGFDPALLSGAKVSAVMNDCEAGPVPVALMPEDEAEIRRIVNGARVGLKKSAVSVTGGFTTYYFTGMDGNVVASFDLYEGALYVSDGMYELIP